MPSIHLSVRMKKWFDPIFTVTDYDTSAPIVGATVTVSGYPPVVTNSSGVAQSASVTKGTYSYTVTATDYETVTSTFTAG